MTRGSRVIFRWHEICRGFDASAFRDNSCDGKRMISGNLLSFQSIRPNSIPRGFRPIPPPRLSSISVLAHVCVCVSGLLCCGKRCRLFLVHNASRTAFCIFCYFSMLFALGAKNCPNHARILLQSSKMILEGALKINGEPVVLKMRPG